MYLHEHHTLSTDLESFLHVLGEPNSQSQILCLLDKLLLGNLAHPDHRAKLRMLDGILTKLQIAPLLLSIKKLLLFSSMTRLFSCWQDP